MEAQVFEGTFADIRRQLIALPLEPDTLLRVTVTEPETSDPGEQVLLTRARKRNGLILVPTRNGRQRVTTELVNELSED
jgi:hypothetical protein